MLGKYLTTETNMGDLVNIMQDKIRTKEDCVCLLKEFKLYLETTGEDNSKDARIIERTIYYIRGFLKGRDVNNRYQTEMLDINVWKESIEEVLYGSTNIEPITEHRLLES